MPVLHVLFDLLCDAAIIIELFVEGEIQQDFGPRSPLPIKNGMGNVVGSTEKEEVSHFTRRPLTSEKRLPRQVLS